jgi:DNA repair exonuclease SbcCD nuclease subunit
LVRFLHSGDWQLGMTRSVLSDEAQARFADARFTAIRRMGEIARETRCDFILVCGDVFESNQVDRRTLARALDALGDVALPVYLLPGNHDPLDAASLFRSAAFTDAAPAHVHVLDDHSPHEVAAGVELVAAPWHSRRPEANPAMAALDALGPPGPLRILAAHGGADLLTPDRRDATLLPMAPIERALAEERLHYAALGDRHSLTQVGTSGRVFYAGTPEPTDYEEREPGFALLVELERDAVHTEPRRVGTWCFARLESVILDGDRDLEALAERLADFEAKERTVLRLELAGRLDLRAAARLESLLERTRDLFAGLDVRDADLRVAAEEEDLADLELSGFAARAAATLRDASQGGDSVSRDALALLVRLASESGEAA